MEKTFLDRLPARDRTALIASLQRAHYSSGQSVLMQDDHTDDVYIVLSGSAVAESVSEQGKLTIYRAIEAGAVFGELSAIDRAPRSASVEGKGDLVVGRLARARFKELIDTSASFRWAMLEHLAEQSRKMTDRIFEYSTMLVADRVVTELIRLGETAGESDGHAELRPAPKHQDIAARISTHREAVSREMSQLAKQGLISRHGKDRLSIDLNGLRAIRYCGIGHKISVASETVDDLPE